MARPSKKNQTTAGDVDAIGADDAGESADTPDIEEGKIFDYITGGPLKDTDKEQVRQRIARAIIHEYGIAAEDMYPGPTTPDLEWQTWIVYSAIPLGSSLMCFRFLQVTLSFIKTGELPSHDHGHVDGIEDGEIPIDVNPYQMDDELHPHDLKYSKRHPEAKVGADDTAAGDKGDAK